jgi:hypothetical protein
VAAFKAWVVSETIDWPAILDVWQKAYHGLCSMPITHRTHRTQHMHHRTRSLLESDAGQQFICDHPRWHPQAALDTTRTRPAAGASCACAVCAVCAFCAFCALCACAVVRGRCMLRDHNVPHTGGTRGTRTPIRASASPFRVRGRACAPRASPPSRSPNTYLSSPPLSRARSAYLLAPRPTQCGDSLVEGE